MKLENKAQQISDHRIYRPPGYIEKQISPVISADNLSREVVWTYLVALKHHDDQQSLVNKLCGSVETLPGDSKIWIEAYMHPTRTLREEVKWWRSRADLAIGYLKGVKGRKHQIQGSGEWINIVEAKFYDDIHPNSKYPEIYQYSQIIEHALLLHDSSGNFPERVYVTLLTPRHFKESRESLSHRRYKEKFEEYNRDKSILRSDLKLCPLRFLEYDLDTLLSRIDSLILRWVTFEDLLGLPDLVNHRVPGKYQVTVTSWEQVFDMVEMKQQYKLLVGD